MSEIDRTAEEAIRIYKEWLRDRSIARPYEEFRRECGLDKPVQEPKNIVATLDVPGSPFD